MIQCTLRVGNRAGGGGEHVVVDTRLGKVGDNNTVAITTVAGAGGCGGHCRHCQATRGMMLGLEGHGGMPSLLLLGDAGAGDMGRCIVLVMAIHHCWMTQGGGWACWH